MTTLAERIETAEQGYVVEAQGLKVVGEITTKAEWEAVGRSLAARGSATSWALGDWILLHRGEYGERYRCATQVTGMSYGHVRALAMTAETYRPGSREPVTLGWSFFRYAAHLAPGKRKELLSKAAEHGWTLDQMCDAVKAAGTTTPTPRQAGARAAAASRRREEYVKCPVNTCGHVFRAKGNFVSAPKEKA